MEENYFLIFKHKPRIIEGDGECVSITEKIIYKYPDTIPDEKIEHLLGFLITMITLSKDLFECDSVDFIECSNSNFGIYTIEGDEIDHYFALKLSKRFNKKNTINIVKKIYNCLFFFFGPSFFSNNTVVTEGITNKLNDIVKYMISDENLSNFDFTFYNIFAEWYRDSLSACVQASLLNKIDEVYGSALFLNDLVVFTDLPADLVIFFRLIKETTDVFISREFYNKSYHDSTQEYIKKKIIIVVNDCYKSYIIIERETDHKLIEEITVKTRNRLSSCSMYHRPDSFEYSRNTLKYSGRSIILRSGEYDQGAKNEAILSYDLLSDNNSREVFICSPDLFTLSFKINGFFFSSSVSNDKGKTTQDLYRNAYTQHPELDKCIRKLIRVESGVN